MRTAMSKFDEIIHLTNQLNVYRDAYYNHSVSYVSDKMYDDMFDRLMQLEKENNFSLSNSPTHTVGYEVVDELHKVKHDHLMLSLDKTKSCDDLVSFAGHRKVCLSMKLDGLTMSVKYVGGELVSAETRGNGIEGTDVLHNAKVMVNLPQTIDYKGTLVIDGECIILRDDFEKINNKLPEEERYATQRNLASGSLTLLDSSVAAWRGLRFYAWSVIEGSTGSFSDDMFLLSNLGFKTAPFLFFANEMSSEDFEDMTQNLKSRANELGIPIDGCVITYDDIQYGLSLGNTGHHFRKSLAFKFEDETAETRITGIDWNVGRTGVVVPTATFETVILDNTEVSRASVHNLTVMKALGLTKNCTAYIYKANQIVPQIQSCEDDGDEEIDIPETCPCCGETLVRNISDNGTETLNCINDNCPARHLAKFTHFVSRKAMNVNGLSEKTLEVLISHGFLHNYKDIYHLKDYRDKLILLDGLGEKSVDKLLDSIEESRTVTLDRFITAIGIPNIGSSAAKTISGFCKGNVYNLFNAFFNNFDWTKLDDFGDTMAYNIEEYLRNHVADIEELADEMHFIVEDMSSLSESLDGKSFCITGSLTHYANRDALIKAIEDNGGKYVSGVSKKTDYLINNDTTSTSGKNKKAIELNIPIINEEAFLKMIGDPLD